MKKKSLYFLVLVLAQLSYSQKHEDKILDSVISLRLSSPNSINKNNYTLKNIADILYIEDENFQYLIFLKWTINYLSYKVKSNGTPIKRILLSRQGDCYHYSEIMDSLCKYRGFRCGLVSGYIKEKLNSDGSFNLVAHIWTFIWLNGKLNYTDVLWSDEDEFLTNSMKFNRTFVLKSSEEFALTHFANKKKNRPKGWSFSKFMSFPLITTRFMDVILFESDILKHKYNNLSDFLEGVNLNNNWEIETETFNGFYLVDESEELLKMDIIKKDNIHLQLPNNWDETLHINYSICIALRTEEDSCIYYVLFMK